MADFELMDNGVCQIEIVFLTAVIYIEIQIQRNNFYQYSNQIFVDLNQQKIL